MFTRRQFLKLSTTAGAGMMLASRLPFLRRAYAAIPGGSLDPTVIPKYLMPLVIPPAMPRTSKIKITGGKNADYYEIAVRQFRQHILPPTLGLQPTKVWGYGSVSNPASFNYPAFTIEAKWRSPVRVKWINDLKDGDGNFLSHLLAVDQTLHWANPPGGTSGRDSRPSFSATPGPYTGPVPLVTHLHGTVGIGQESDGYPEAWYLPVANNIPAGYAKAGSWYERFKGEAAEKFGVIWQPGTATFQYPNDQRATALWYHDHTLGMTRLNVYAGPAGFYLLRGGPDDQVADSRRGTSATLPGPAPALGDAPGMKYYEIPLAIQDRSFDADGSLFYPDSRYFFDEFGGPYIPQTDVAPIWNPEFFGNTMAVNGRTWPFLEVEQRRYRFRILNGCNSRFLLLKFDSGPSFWQIGTEGGFLPAPLELNRLLMAPAERADVIVDFTNLPVGTTLTLLNIGPDEPFGGGEPPDDFDSADSETTGQVMQFRVVTATSRDRSTPPQYLQLPAITPLAGGTERKLAVLEMRSMYTDGPAAAMLGVVDSGGEVMHKMWGDPVTENPAAGATEVWEFHNHTVDAHPIHLHQVHFQVVNRETAEGVRRGPEAWETGFKDTVVAYPGEVTRIRARFEVPGRYVWHCHIVEHEDNEMMRPYDVIG